MLKCHREIILRIFWLIIKSKLFHLTSLILIHCENMKIIIPDSIVLDQDHIDRLNSIGILQIYDNSQKSDEELSPSNQIKHLYGGNFISNNLIR